MAATVFTVAESPAISPPLACGKFHIYSAAFVILLMTAIISSALFGNRMKVLAAQNYQNYHCDTSNRESDQVLHILDLFMGNTQELVDQLCHQPSITAQYHRVEVSWMHRNEIDLQLIFKQHYQLLLAKPELMSRIQTWQSGEYLDIIRFPDYVSQLLSLQGPPSLSREYFSGKILGLIDDANSLSGYQVPMAALEQAGIGEQDYQLALHPSHYQLHQALRSGEVDVIASFSSSVVPSDASHHSLALHKALPGLRWYLQPTLLDSAIHCQLLHSLQQFIVHSDNDYLNALVVSRPCHMNKWAVP